MKILNIILLTLLLLFTPKLYAQIKDIQLRIVNTQNEPIDAVCVGVAAHHRFWYSDTVGVVLLPLEKFSSKDSLTFLHISYKPKTIDLKSLIALQDDEWAIRLTSDVIPLDEVVVKPLDPKQYLKEAIALIPSLYAPFLASPLSLNAEIDVFDANDSTSMLYYKGALQLSQPKGEKRPSVSKGNDIEEIADGAQKQLYPIRITKCMSMMSINSNDIVRRPDRYTFDKYQYIQYRGESAVQLFYHYEKRKIKVTGYVIIEDDTKAILATHMTMYPLKKAMLSIVKRRKRFTDIDFIKQDVNYSLNAEGLYEFESGVQQEEYTNHIRKEKKRIAINSYLNKIDSTGIVFGTETPVNKFLMQ